ncbi:MAG: hypothetical protein A2Y77_04900 [Planctomycetes bacterium RBG_13_62_9]|nr:MAG: hypothetical protein A2Y77_04900 [Planctomycetes bacterium RBG_13_62_9]
MTRYAIARLQYTAGALAQNPCFELSTVSQKLGINSESLPAIPRIADETGQQVQMCSHEFLGLGVLGHVRDFVLTAAGTYHAILLSKRSA